MTIREIAKLAKVSPSAVSLVLNNKPGISEETRKHITDIIMQYGYVQNRKKSKLSHGVIRFLKYKVSGIIVEENDGFIAAIIDQIEKECRARSFDLVLSTFTHDEISDVINIISSNVPDGVILLGTELLPEMIPLLKNVSVPLIVVDNYMAYHSFDSVVMNNQEIAYQAVQHLASLQHIDIGYLKSSIPISNFNERSIGFYHAVEKLNLCCSDDHVFLLNPSFSGAYNDMVSLLSNKRDLPGAFFADNDTIAIGAIKALTEFGFRIPQDISIIGIDDIPIGAISDPPLTTMRIDRNILGLSTLKLLLDRIENPMAPVMKLQIGASLIARGSTAPKTI